MGSMRMLLAVALAAASLACGGSGNTSPSNVGATSYTGVLGDGSIASLQFASAVSQALTASPAVAAAGDVTVTGTLTKGATAVALGGTYNPTTKALVVTGTSGGQTYSLSGLFSDGVFKGAASTPTGTVNFVLMAGDSSAVTRYCGTYREGDSSTGTFMLVVQGGTAYGISGSGDPFSGTVAAGAVHMTAAGGVPITGTISGGSVSGTFTNDKGPGTWSGTTAACPGSGNSSSGGSSSGGSSGGSSSGGASSSGGSSSGGSSGGGTGTVQGACDFTSADRHVCAEWYGWPPSVNLSSERGSCAGTWSDTTLCSTTGRVGSCTQATPYGTKATHYYTGTSAAVLTAAETYCTGTWKTY